MNRRDIFRFFGGAAAIPTVRSIELLEIEKEDTLIVSVDCEISGDTAEFLRGQMAQKFPEVKRVVVLSKGLSLKVLRSQK